MSNLLLVLFRGHVMADSYLIILGSLGSEWILAVAVGIPVHLVLIISQQKDINFAPVPVQVWEEYERLL